MRHLKWRIERFLEIIENTGFDVIGGGVEEGFKVGTNLSFFNNWLNYGKYKVTKGAHGDCISREFGFHGKGFQLNDWKIIDYFIGYVFKLNLESLKIHP